MHYHRGPRRGGDSLAFESRFNGITIIGNGFDGRDELAGDPGPQTLKGGKGREDLQGDGGPDVLRGGPDADRLDGGGGDDDCDGKDEDLAVKSCES